MGKVNALRVTGDKETFVMFCCYCCYCRVETHGDVCILRCIVSELRVSHVWENPTEMLLTTLKRGC